ncbi:hypothetical protein PoB_002093600 [Plakobranchus ocellatus]|uniref:Uncharacterized protein n=1 Tax=Plakobranchus ocellatus TaxID=259542 RepID=A0AAV3Z559_9GAST|nr:hypothetical protein PoB_002093600 [Plakobranchus ocellatus]
MASHQENFGGLPAFSLELKRREPATSSTFMKRQTRDGHKENLGGDFALGPPHAQVPRACQFRKSSREESRPAPVRLLRDRSCKYLKKTYAVITSSEGNALKSRGPPGRPTGHSERDPI